MDELLSKVKANLILEHTADDELLKGYITAAVSYAESYQHIGEGYYSEHPMPPTTEQAVIMLSSHFYESRDGSTGGFFADNTGAAQQVWNTVNLLLRLDRDSKFKVEERCHTPTVNTETVQRLFTQAYNRMMENREQIIKDCETMRRALTDFAELDAEIERQLEETQVVAELVKAAVKENASTAQSQEAYLRKYEALTERYEKAAAELERLQNLRTTQSQQDKAMALYIRTLKKQPVVLREWSDTIWTVMVEKAIVHRNGAITFVFKNGTEVKVGE